MANSLRGEVGFEVEKVAYKFRFSLNSLIELEDELELKTNDLIALLRDPNFVTLKMLRIIFWAGLLEHHELSIKEAGSVADGLGVQAAADIIGKAFTLAFPPPDAAKPARPQKGVRVGTGKAS